MKEVLIREYLESDIYDIIEIPNEPMATEHPEFKDWARIKKEKGTAYTCTTKEGTIICSFGIQILWEGVGEVWVTFADDGLLKEYARETAVHTRMILDEMQEHLNLWRLQADVLADIEVSNRFIKHFGFKLEGRMEKYSPYGFDVNRYARVRG